MPFPPSFFSRLASRGLLAPGRRALDLGTGTGAIALPLSHRGLSVVGIDIAEGQLAQARRRGGTVDFRRAPAEATGLPDASFDLVFAGQCWHWFDRPKAAQEAARVLKPGGTLVIAHLDWLCSPGSVPDRTQALASSYGSFVSPKIREQQLNSLYGPWLADLAGAGFGAIESFSYDVDLNYSQVGWRGRVRASALVGASMPDELVQRFDADLAREIAEEPDPMPVPHRIFVALGVRGGSTGRTSAMRVGDSPALPPDRSRAIEGATMSEVTGGDEPIRLMGKGPLVVVDDDPDDLEIMAIAFSRSKLTCELKQCRSGAEFLDYTVALASEHGTKPALVLMDINMPGIDGFETVSRLRSRREFRQVPVVCMLTSSPDPKDVRRALGAGASHYSSKPMGMRAYVAYLDSLAPLD